MGDEYGVAPNNNYDFIVSISTKGGTKWAPIWDESELGVFNNYEDIYVVMSSFTPGIYIVNVTSGDSVKSLKIVKQ